MSFQARLDAERRRSPPATREPKDASPCADRATTEKAKPDDVDPGARQSSLNNPILEAREKRAAGATSRSLDSEAIAVSSEAQLPIILDVHPESHTFQESEPDVTVDLSHPRSTSGNYWKVEYEGYHDKSNREIKKLIKYTQNAKSYAVKKDRVAITLKQKLQEQLAKVKEMETKISELASQLVARNVGASEGGAEQAELLSELATQTAQALRFKQKADKYQSELHERSLSPGAIAGEQGYKLKTAGVLNEEQNRSQEIASLRTNVENLNATVKSAESRAVQLEKENTSLKETILRVKQEMHNYEKRHTIRESKRKEREENLERRVIEAEAEVDRVKKQLEEETKKPRKIMTVQDQKSAVDIWTTDTPSSKIQSLDTGTHNVVDPEYETTSKRRNPLGDSNKNVSKGPLPIESSRLTIESVRNSTLKPKMMSHGVPEELPPYGDTPSAHALGNKDNTPLRSSHLHLLADSLRMDTLPDLYSKTNRQPETVRYVGQGPISSSSRASSMRNISQIPPDRIAAAQKRLEHRTASKRNTPARA